MQENFVALPSDMLFSTKESKYSLLQQEIRASILSWVPAFGTNFFRSGMVWHYETISLWRASMALYSLFYGGS